MKCRKNQGAKKTEWTDQIFKNIRSVNADADLEPDTIRISLDTKATIHVGDYSRGGKSRCTKPVKALDHEMMPKEKLVPGGILETASGKAFSFFTESNKTSDFIVDGIELWWNTRKDDLGTVRRLVINMDNGPECSGRRTQFLERMVEFPIRAALKYALLITRLTTVNITQSNITGVDWKDHGMAIFLTQWTP